MSILSADQIRVNVKVSDKYEAIRLAGQMLVDAGHVEQEYVDKMIERENALSTYMGAGLAIPHGTNEAKGMIKSTGLAVLQIPDGVDFGGDEPAVLVVGIAAQNVQTIQQRGSYTVTIADENGKQIPVEGVNAIDGRDPAAVAEAVASADMVTTAVGVNILKHIAPGIAAGLKLRMERGAAPLHVIACENAIGASTQLKEHVMGHLSLEEQQKAASFAAFPDSAVDRIVPLQHHEDPLAVTVEPFYEWVINRSQIDEVVRVGRSPIRKLSPDDRLVRPALRAWEQGGSFEHLTEVMALALKFDFAEDPEAVKLQSLIADQGARQAFAEVSGLDPDHTLTEKVLKAYNRQ
ncbi:hypothetical protein BGX30_007436 [Mortierella sp. GBA39]|nr:hypothetical protein BGX30_007436 [Mortierella sp. GBA39]